MADTKENIAPESYIYSENDTENADSDEEETLSDKHGKDMAWSNMATYRSVQIAPYPNAPYL